MPTQEEQFAIDFERFLFNVRETKTIWMLKHNDGFAMCPSNKFEDTKVVLFWSSEEAAQAHLQAEWQAYELHTITAKEFLATWLKQLHNDGNALIGADWSTDLVGPEIEPDKVASSLILDIS